MPQSSGRFRLALEPLEEFRFGGQPRHDHLHCHRPHRAQVRSLEDRSHRAPSQLAVDLIFLV